METAKYWAEKAIAAQDGGNIVGIVNLFAELVVDLNDVARVNSKSDNWVQYHPLTIMFAEKVGSLTGTNDSSTLGPFGNAYKWCKELLKNEEKKFFLKHYNY